MKNGLESNFCNNKTLKERLIDFLTSCRLTLHTVANWTPAEMFIGRNIRTRIHLTESHQTLEVNSNPHKNSLTLRTLSSNDHAIVRRYGPKQKWQHEKIVERISFKMYKVLINWKIEDKHTLHERCQNTEFFLVRIFMYSDWIRENTDQRKLRIWTLFTIWTSDFSKLKIYIRLTL